MSGFQFRTSDSHVTMNRVGDNRNFIVNRVGRLKRALTLMIQIVKFSALKLSFSIIPITFRGTDRKTPSSLNRFFFIEDILQIPLYGFPYHNNKAIFYFLH